MYHLFYDQLDIENPEHTIDQKNGSIDVNTDYKQNRLDANFCGQHQLDKYICKFENFNLK